MAQALELAPTRKKGAAMSEHADTVTLNLTVDSNEYYSMESQARRHGTTVPDMLRDYMHAMADDDDTVAVLKTPQETRDYFNKVIEEARDDRG